MSARDRFVAVRSEFFGIAVSHLEESGAVRLTRFPMGGVSVKCPKTGQEVAHQYAGNFDGTGSSFVEPDFFAHITVNGNRYRELTGTEREMISCKLEARARGDAAKEAEYQLPPWTIGIYQKAVADGLKTFRGRTSQVAMPFTMTFEQALIREEEVAAPSPRPRG